MSVAVQTEATDIYSPSDIPLILSKQSVHYRAWAAEFERVAARLPNSQGQNLRDFPRMTRQRVKIHISGREIDLMTFSAIAVEW